MIDVTNPDIERLLSFAVRSGGAGQAAHRSGQQDVSSAHGKAIILTLVGMKSNTADSGTISLQQTVRVLRHDCSISVVPQLCPGKGYLNPRR